MFDLSEAYEYEKMGAEENLFKNLLIQNIRDEAERRNLIRGQDGLPPYKLPVKSINQIENKEKRIYTLEPKVEHGHIVFNRTIGQEFWNQMFEFPKGEHDDGPDALEMLWSLANNFYDIRGFKRPDKRVS